MFKIQLFRLQLLIILKYFSAAFTKSFSLSLSADFLFKKAVYYVDRKAFEIIFFIILFCVRKVIVYRLSLYGQRIAIIMMLALKL